MSFCLLVTWQKMENNQDNGKSQKTSFGEPETKKSFLCVDQSRGLNAVKPQVQKAHKHRIEYSSSNMHIRVDMAEDGPTHGD